MSAGRRRTALCAACHRVVAVRFTSQNRGGGKARVRHKCPHGRWCVSGQPMGIGGWNAGGPAHYVHCRTCAMERHAERVAAATAREAASEAPSEPPEPPGTTGLTPP